MPLQIQLDDLASTWGWREGVVFTGWKRQWNFFLHGHILMTLECNWWRSTSKAVPGSGFNSAFGVSQISFILCVFLLPAVVVYLVPLRLMYPSLCGLTWTSCLFTVSCRPSHHLPFGSNSNLKHSEQFPLWTKWHDDGRIVLNVQPLSVGLLFGIVVTKVWRSKVFSKDRQNILFRVSFVYV